MRLIEDSQLRPVILLIIAALIVHSYASTVSVTTVNLQSQYALVFDVTNKFTAMDQGFNNVTLTQPASPQPCLWINGTSCNTALTAPHLQYSLVLTLNTPPTLLTTYTITVLLSQNGNPQTQLGQLTVSVSALALAGQQMTFQFDTGGTSLTSPLSVDVTVA